MGEESKEPVYLRRSPRGHGSTSRSFTSEYPRRIIGRTRKEGGGEWTNIVDDGSCRQIEIPLKDGGLLRVWPNVMPRGKTREAVDEALKTGRGLFSQYLTGQFKEPRVSALLGENGYKYNNVAMKPQKLEAFPTVAAVAQLVSLAVAGEDFLKLFNLGANIVLYRDGKDSIWFHADDNNQETHILTFVLKEPSPVLDGGEVIDRRVIAIRRKGEGGKQNAHIIELFLNEGDAYEMDGAMQALYEHAVPKFTAQCVDDASTLPDPNLNSRMVMVLRRGRLSDVKKDTGEPVATLAPPRRWEKPVYMAENPHALVECKCYRLADLVEMNML
jgi:alkylated DNA repair dioxygenase AlkB